jgi:hypothetical protein
MVRLPYATRLHRRRQAYASRLIEPIPIKTKVDGSGTAVIVLPEGPPAIDWIVSVESLPMVRVSTAMLLAIRLHCTSKS